MFGWMSISLLTLALSVTMYSASNNRRSEEQDLMLVCFLALPSACFGIVCFFVWFNDVVMR